MADPHAAPAPTDADYARGDMEIGEHRSTYRAFDGLVRFGSLGVAALILLLTIWFCTGAGLFAAAIPTALLVGVGVVFLRKQPASVDTL